MAILVGGMQLRTFSRLRYHVAVSDDGIRYMPHGDSPTFLQWREIANLELRERLGDARLVISDATRLRQMNLDYRLDRFQDLLSFVADHATNCDPHPPLPSSFHIGYLEQTVVVIVFFVAIGGSIYFVRTGQSINAPATAFGLFALIPVAMLAALPHSMTVSTDSIVINYLGWRREIAVASVTGVRFGIERGSRGSVWTVVWLGPTRRAADQTTGLFRRFDGSLLLLARRMADGQGFGPGSGDAEHSMKTLALALTLSLLSVSAQSIAAEKAAMVRLRDDGLRRGHGCNSTASRG